ncbi:MAG: hypothetical protein KF697_15720 [Pseudolabrys sp.]|nr:hypothetical protein [Pseudolabrys sp.]
MQLGLEEFREIERKARALRPIDGGFDLNAGIIWQEGVRPPTDCDEFAREAIFVICNSGMKHTVARGIFDRVMRAIARGASAAEAFGHPGKAAAIDHIWENRSKLLGEFLSQALDDARLEYLGKLPWIGSVTKFHLAKNFGVDVAKPDVHLVRLARAVGKPVNELCRELAEQSGYRIATVDLILWFACARGIIDKGALQAA